MEELDTHDTHDYKLGY